MNKRLSINQLAASIATLGPIGHFPKAPGTWGSLAAIIASPWVFLSLPLVERIGVLLVILFVGTWACSKAEHFFEQKDPGCVIIDEVFGQWLALLFYDSFPLWGLLVAFMLFRIFDIFKPWPVKWAENNFSGGLGVMMDDGVAGLYALIILQLIISLF